MADSEKEGLFKYIDDSGKTVVLYPKTKKELVEGVDKIEEAISNEINRAKGAEADITSALSAEIARAQGEESALSLRVQNEVQRASSSESSLGSRIDSEVSRATQAESDIDSGLTNEIARATQAEGVLKTSIDTLNTSLQTEVSERQSSDSTLSSDISDLRSDLSKEVTRATTSEDSLRVDLNEEIARAKSSESGIDTRVTLIEKVIPDQASEDNVLADKNFVNSSINSSSAFYIGEFDSKAALDAWQTDNPTQATNNDYAYIEDDETHNHEAWRYVYAQKNPAIEGIWKPQFKVNDAPLTAVQLAALNSGITSQKVSEISEKLPKSTSNDIIYGTDSEGNQTTYQKTDLVESLFVGKLDGAKSEAAQNGEVYLKLASGSGDFRGRYKVSGSNGVVVTSDASGNISISSQGFVLPVATETTLGGVKVGFLSQDKFYAVQLNSDSQMYVSVPWTDTVTRIKLGSQTEFSTGDIHITPQAIGAVDLTSDQDITGIKTFSSKAYFTNIWGKGSSSDTYAGSITFSDSGIVIDHTDLVQIISPRQVFKNVSVQSLISGESIKAATGVYEGLTNSVRVYSPNNPPPDTKVASSAFDSSAGTDNIKFKITNSDGTVVTSTNGIDLSDAGIKVTAVEVIDDGNSGGGGGSSVEYSAGVGLNLTDTTFSLKPATQIELGGVKIYTTTVNGKTVLHIDTE